MDDDDDYDDSSGYSTPSALLDEFEDSSQGIRNSSMGSTGSPYDALGLGKQDASLIQYSRILFLAALISAAASLTFVVYFTLRNDQQNDFRKTVRRMTQVNDRG